jgi:hypothetical protein
MALPLQMNQLSLQLSTIPDFILNITLALPETVKNKYLTKLDLKKTWFFISINMGAD